MAQETILYIKASIIDPDSGKIGACPFSQRVMMALVLKGIPYTPKPVSLGANKPNWFLALNPAGKVPVYVKGDKVVPDSGEIVMYLEKEFPTPSLKVDQVPPAVSNLKFGKLFGLVTNKDASLEEGKKHELIEELEKLENVLKSSFGRFILGDEPSAAECDLLPKLHQARVANKAIKGFEIPKKFEALWRYFEAGDELPAFKTTKADDSEIIAGWKKH